MKQGTALHERATRLYMSGKCNVSRQRIYREHGVKNLSGSLVLAGSQISHVR